MSVSIMSPPAYPATPSSSATPVGPSSPSVPSGSSDHSGQESRAGPPPYMPEPFGGPMQELTPYYLDTDVFNHNVPPTLPGYDPKNDVKAIYDATHGAGTNDSRLITTFLARSSKEMQVLGAAYHNSTKKTLVERVIDETSKIYQVGMVMLASGVVGGDSYLLRIANKQDKETKMALLTDIIIGRRREEIEVLRHYMKCIHLVDLDAVVIDAIHSKKPFTQHLFTQSLRVAVHQGPYDLAQDYDTLQKNIGAGPSDTVSNAILPKIIDRPPPHIQQLDQMWRKYHFDNPLAESIALHFAAKPEAVEILRHVIRASDNQGGRYSYGLYRDAEKIHEAIMAKNHLLITTRLIRAHWNKERFQQIISIVDGLRTKDGNTRRRVLDIVSPIFSRPLHKLLDKLLDTANA